MRPLLIEFLAEIVKSLLLLHQIATSRPGSLGFEGPVHALVLAILLGVSRLCSGRSESDPPRRCESDPPRRAV